MTKLFILTITILFSNYTFPFSENHFDKNQISEKISPLNKYNKIDIIRCVWPPCDDEI